MRNFMKSNNPIFKNQESKAWAATVTDKRTGGPILDSSTNMTVSGAVNKTMILGGILMITTLYSYLLSLIHI